MMRIKVYGPIDNIDILLTVPSEISLGEFLRRALPVAKSSADSFARVAIIDLKKPQGMRRNFSFTIKIDDFLEDPLRDLLIKNVIAGEEKFEDLDLRAYVAPALSPVGMRETRFNPNGYREWHSYFRRESGDPYRPIRMNDEEKEVEVFFDAMRYPERYKTYSERIAELEIPLDNIPPMFIDPITNTVMDDPIIMDDFHTYDRSTVARTHGRSPFTRAPYKEIQQQLFIRSEMEIYIEDQALIKQMIRDGKNPLECPGLHPRDRVLRAYNILGISQNSTLQTLKSSFRGLALLHSPDRGGNQKLYIIMLSAYKFIIAEKHTPKVEVAPAEPLWFFGTATGNSLRGVEVRANSVSLSGKDKDNHNSIVDNLSP